MSSSAARLKDYLTGVADVPDIAIRGIAIDSREVRAGDLFVALAGTIADGHAFIGDAVAAGAVAVLAERPVDSCGVPLMFASDARIHAGRIAASLAGDPSADLGCVAVTGTNGKTSVACFVAYLLNAVGEPAGYGGTLGWSFGDHTCGGGLTTEDAVMVQQRLAKLRELGAKWAAMEVSSHALAQDRVSAVRFDIAAFTNLTRDHLDYHGDMTAYAAAKHKLFRFPSLAGGVVNLDDPMGRELYVSRAAALELLGVGRAADAEMRFSAVRFDNTGTAAVLDTPWGRHELHVPVFGEFSFHNVLVALGVCCLAGHSLDELLDAAATLTAPPGRMQFVDLPGRAAVVIDYAHTPDALEKALAAARAHCTGPLVCVFGCGGNRDAGKRPLMAEAVERGADIAIVTNDNPRDESPKAIADAILTAFSETMDVRIELDRAKAIEDAVALAGETGMVLITGKGHETYQEISGQRIPYSDLDAVQRLAER